MKHVAAVILAAGKGTRMKSARPKVVHEVSGLPLVVHMIRQVRAAGVKKIVVVVGYEKEQVIRAVEKEQVICAVQKEQKGTGHALLSSQAALRGHRGEILVVAGDVFFDKVDTLCALFDTHKAEQNDLTVLTTVLDTPFGYGRIIRNESNGVVSIREEVDASSEEKSIQEINTGIYVFDSAEIFSHMKKVRPDNKKKEYYLTSAVDMYATCGKRVGAYICPSSGTDAILGVNDRTQLAVIQAMSNRAIIEMHQRNGVTVIDPQSTYIEGDVTIGQDTVIYPFTYIEKNVVIGKNCAVGPFCKIRSHSVIGDETAAGSFVEIVRSRVGKKTNIKHLSYIGDAEIGNQVNVGAGTITANYDGVHKHKTVIGNNAFIGSNTVLIAPAAIGNNARTGAGAVVPRNKPVPAGKIAIGVPARVVMAQTHKRK